MMKFGANTFIWRSPFSTERDLDVVEKVAGMGFDLIEFAIEDPELIDLQDLKGALEEHGLGAIACGAFGPGRNISSLEPSEREAAKEYLRWMVDAAEFMGSPVVTGPMYSAVGKPRLESASDRQREWEYAVTGLAEMASFAADRGVKLAFEPLNRFENDMVNVAEQGMRLIEDVGADNLGLHLDTFHMHLEEKDSAAAVRLAGDRLFHFHACENDRGIPGTGQVQWQPVFQSLSDIDYQQGVVIESFTPDVQSIARAVCIWREIAPDQDSIAHDGLAFLKSLPGPA
jgi:D-psicose/D-tagatose/L-ribulose 3-epimerase